MSNIAKAFENGAAFIGFVTGGDPSMEKTKEFIREMIRGGADLVEIGIPFSDPIAEGPVIQAANIRALKAGATVEKLFTLVEELRRETAVPLMFLSYLNPVYRYGYKAFFERCQKTGLDGIIIPDLPFEEQGEVREFSSRCGVDLISLIAPTSEERIQEIARSASGFLYLVSSLGVTGMRSNIATDLAAMVAKVKTAAKLPVAKLPVAKLPVAVGFGIHSPKQAAEIAKMADGVIVGSAIVKIVEEQGGAAGPSIYRYVKEMKEAVRFNKEDI
jgi:tryptophan synthase alpha chain